MKATTQKKKSRANEEEKIASHYTTCHHSPHILKNKLLRNIAQHKFLSSFTDLLALASPPLEGDEQVKK